MWPTTHLALRYAPLVLATTTMLQVLSFLVVADTQSLGFDMLDPQPLHALTSLFAHASVAHLASNLVLQTLLGPFVECLHGHGPFFLVYFGAGLLAAASYRVYWRAFVDPRPTYLIGSSGAVYGLMGAYASHLLLNWSELPSRFFWLSVLLLTLVVDVGVFLIQPTSDVAYSAHVGGGVAGLCIGLLVLRNVRPLRWEQALRVLALLLLVCMLGAATS